MELLIPSRGPLETRLLVWVGQELAPHAMMVFHDLAVFGYLTGGVEISEPSQRLVGLL